ncbi:hypothetical protein ACFYE9_17385 [Rhizobium leguminosarum]|uniref:Uncharacterized protein n=2 Tax=Rhizobium leguminosarum TaxID=384 RepID=A0A154IA74_RHILE|nr:hypothetical protein [Rhizobium leguminosarum]KZA97478.1 hypothetical protein A4A59_04825 [Rhizobium leguminosarum]
MPPELRALVHDAANRLKDENYRNGKKARAHKDQMKADYADVIRATEGRDVRAYVLHGTDEERKKARREQRALSKANRSPDQIAKEREADRERKASKAREKKAAAAKALRSAENFGKF